MPCSRVAGAGETVDSLGPTAEPRHWRMLLAIAVLLYLITLAIRLPHFISAAPHPDEEHWVSRSGRMLRRIESGHYSVATSHLGHPGIPAASAMAAGQYLANRLNGGFEWQPSDPLFLDRLAASRLANIFVSSLLIPLVFLGGALLINPAVGTLAAALLALDPRHVDLSQLAHIDGVLALLTTTTLFLFIWAERRQSPILKCCAGFSWGLALATKPTAVALLPALIIYKAARWGMSRWTLTRSSATSGPALLGWSDLWAVVFGHVALALFWTKLWSNNNNFIVGHGADPRLSYTVRSIGVAFSTHPILALVAATVFIVALLRIRQEKGRHLAHAAAILASALLALAVVPTIIENILRFWWWVGGLSKQQHVAYGKVWQSVPLGYLEIWFRRLPSTALIGLLLGVGTMLRLFYLLFSSKSRRTQDSATAAVRELALLLLLLFSVAALWTALLSTSDKQTVRYLMPVYPAVFLIASVGWFAAFSSLFSGARPTTGGGAGGHPSTTTELLPSTPQQTVLLGGVLVLIQALTFYSWYPYHRNFFNSLSGGPTPALARGFKNAPVGYERALEALQKKIGEERTLEVNGDLQMVTFALRRMNSSTTTPIEIKPFSGGYSSAWLLSFSEFGEDWRTALPAGPPPEVVDQLVVHGAPVYTLFRIPPPDYTSPFTLQIHHAYHRTGSMIKDEQLGKVIKTVPGRDSSGFIQFGQYLRGKAGRYRFDYLLHRYVPNPEKTARKQQSGLLPVSDTTPALRLEAGAECSRELKAGELPLSIKQEGVGPKSALANLPLVALHCNFPDDFRVQLRSIWHGSVPLILGDITVQQEG